MNQQVIGTCSICGGAVCVPAAWMSVVPPVATCSQCGAQRAEHGPVIEMQPAPLPRRYTGWDELRAKVAELEDRLAFKEPP